jgi:hypothetical protein
VTGEDLAARLARALITRACGRLPEGAARDRAREWLAELAAILDDQTVSARWRRRARALRFAVGQRRTVRRLTRPTGAGRVRQLAIRSTIGSAAVAIAFVVTALALDPAASRAYSDSSPIVAAEILLFLGAAVAGLACTVLVVSLAVAAAARRFRRHASLHIGVPRGSGAGGARRMSRTGRAALVTMVAGVVASMVGAEGGTIAEAALTEQSTFNTVVSDATWLVGLAGWACLGLSLVLAAVAAALRLWRRAREVVGPLRHGSPAGHHAR